MAADGLSRRRLELINSEISYHYDDLTDIISIPGWTYSQPSATQVIASITEGGPAVGDTINFVNAVTLQAEGTAAITRLRRYQRAGFGSAGDCGAPTFFAFGAIPGDAQRCGAHLRVRYDGRPHFQARSHHHDGQLFARRAGVGLQRQGGAPSHFYEQCCRTRGFSVLLLVLHRTGVGNIPGNITISNNVARDCSYILPNPAPAIVVFDLNANPTTVTGTPIQNVTITRNVVVSPHAVGIQVANAQNVTIAANLIDRPVARAYDQVWNNKISIRQAAAIYVANVGTTRIFNNVVQAVNPSIVPEIISSAGVAPANVSMSNNQATWLNGATAALPNGFGSKLTTKWTRVCNTAVSGNPPIGAWRTKARKPHRKPPAAPSPSHLLGSSRTCMR